MNANDKIGPPDRARTRHQRLDAWLDEIAAELVWSRDIDMMGAETIECYQVGAETLMVSRSKTGFEIFTPLITNSIDASFVDAELRIDLAGTRRAAARAQTLEIPEATS